MNNNVAYERKLFSDLLSKNKAGIYPATPAPHYLRIEAKLTNNTGEIIFRHQSSYGSDVTESKLDKNDLMAVTRIGLFLMKKDTTKQGLGTLQTFPSAVAFPKVITGGSEFDPEHLEAIYNGYLSLKTGSTVNIERLAALNFRTVPQTQQGTGILNQFGFVDMSYVGAEDIFLDGGKTQELKLSFPTFSGMTIESKAANIEHRVVLIATGFILKNAGDKR